ncbi:hypothetical protein Pelo_13984 [Pelomyxa schiedti]|nr:hypothetical protein Pelo_13984 [Pelomyxa schiedti]
MSAQNDGRICDDATVAGRKRPAPLVPPSELALVDLQRTAPLPKMPRCQNMRPTAPANVSAPHPNEWGRITYESGEAQLEVEGFVIKSEVTFGFDGMCDLIWEHSGVAPKHFTIFRLSLNGERPYDESTHPKGYCTAAIRADDECIFLGGTRVEQGQSRRLESDVIITAGTRRT